ncbi:MULTISPECIES: FadR/GntR family transcriptional regulator [Streptomyces]|uniref:FCD domain-containing protein n=1 Tax=Streptomyces griseiscabiei TaxID=2993540 RepID=A0ABU4L694_9ACTN|nr:MULTISPECIES: FCD domain-containing protein [Streptomyces]MBZ3906227.1 FadR family transcriptional regulator [Streptomyces griseiscabiei]MDX2911222.1 FCD domain-containing protein [Streptomyces griseiscabiei]
MLSKMTSSTRLTDRVAATLAEEIASGRIGVGERLPTESQLVTQLGVSRTVVREAITLLRNSGLVESRQGVGVFVLPGRIQPLDLAGEPEPSIAATLRVLEVREAIEVAAARLAAQRASAQQRRSIRRALDAVADAVAKGGDGVKEDLAFHAEIAQATGNEVLASTVSYLGEVMESGIRVSREREALRADFMSAVTAEHEALLAAIEAGDGDAAAAAASTHLHNAATRLRTSGES